MGTDDWGAMGRELSVTEQLDEEKMRIVSDGFFTSPLGSIVQPPKPKHKVTREEIQRALQDHEDGRLVRFDNCSFDGMTLKNWIILNRSSFTNCSFIGTELRGAILRQCCFLKCSFDRAHLCDANFGQSRFVSCSFNSTELTHASFELCSFSNVDFVRSAAVYTKFSNAYFSIVDFSHAYLDTALFNNRQGADTITAINTIMPKETDYDGHFSYFNRNIPPMACPAEGSFTAYKAASNAIVVLEVPEDALRSSAEGRKCRCDKAKVLRIETLDGKDVSENIPQVVSDYHKRFVYRVGETVSVDNFDRNPWKECAPGIHFFMDREEAVKYAQDRL